MPEQTMKRLYSGNLGIDYGQFYIDVIDEDDDDYLDPDGAFDNQENGICGCAQSGKAFFVTGFQVGVIAIEVELHSSEPPINDSYDEIVEAPFHRGDTEVSLCEWGQEATHPLDIPAGAYRLRYCIEGMDKDYDEDDVDCDAPIPGHRHLIQLWPCEPSEDKVIKHTSQPAAYWHREWGGWS